MPEPISLVKALKDYFGIDGNQLIKEFKKLSEQDKADFVEMFEKIGVTVDRTLKK